MINHVLFIVLLLGFSSQGLIYSQDGPELPSDVPPVFATAIVIPAKESNELTSVSLSVPTATWKVIGEERPKTDWPKVEVDVDVTELNLKIEYSDSTQLSDSAQNRVLTIDGRRLDVDEIREQLKGQTSVLVSVSGKELDPYYLQCIKPETLVVVLGISNSPAPELLPKQANEQ